MGRAGGSWGARSGWCGRTFAFPAPASPPSARTFPGAREVMINSGLALSPPHPPCPLGPHPTRPPPSDPAGSGVPAVVAVHRLLSTATRDPPGLACLRRSPSPARPWDPRCLHPSRVHCFPHQHPSFKSFAESLFAPCTTSCGEEKYHCDEMSLKNRLHFPGGCWERH